jgi:heme-degrading monooxygenase HmoA
LSFWRDEEAVARWRGLEAHRMAQVLRDYGLHERDEAPPDARAVHG